MSLTKLNNGVFAFFKKKIMGKKKETGRFPLKKVIWISIGVLVAIGAIVGFIYYKTMLSPNIVVNGKAKYLLVYSPSEVASIASNFLARLGLSFVSFLILSSWTLPFAILNCFLDKSSSSLTLLSFAIALSISAMALS